MAEKNSFLVWPTPQEWTPGTDHLVLSGPLNLVIQGDASWLPAAARQASDVLNQAATGPAVVNGEGVGVTWCMITMENLPPGLKPVTEDEGYVLDVTRSGVLLAGRDARGVFWGAQTLAQLVEDRDGLSLPAATIRDWPRYPIRGAHCYLPAREQMDFFWRFLDFLAKYKCNTLVLELGGGMEYKTHPEINETWVKFCKAQLSYDFDNDPYDSNPLYRGSKRSKESFYSFGTVPHTGPDAYYYSRYFAHDSQHTELAGGSWLTREEIQCIIQECKNRFIEIVPEVQSLSHSYYLCCAHPEIAERADDPWPDSYCPSNPMSYELLFDVMDEVIEVFQPRMMHIGHDEVWTLGICPKCRERTGHDLLASDLQRICEFLAARNVRPSMWCDKVMQPNAKPLKGGDDFTGKKWVCPATQPAVDMIPKNILMWDHYVGEPGVGDSEHYLNSHGFQVAYGNFLGNQQPGRFPDWERRADRAFVLGGATSSWCEVSAYAFGHNHVPFRVFKEADMLWRGEQIEDDYLHSFMVSRLASDLDILRGERRFLVSYDAGRFTPVDITFASRELPCDLSGKVATGKKLHAPVGVASFPVLAGEDGMLERAIVLDKAHPQSRSIEIERKISKLIIIHGTTMQNVYHRPTWGSFHRGPAELLRCQVTYADGKQESFSACFGDDIGPLVGKWPTAALVDAGHRVRRGGYCHQALPIPAGRDHTFFAQEWTNPRPELVITSLTLHLGDDATEHGQVIVAAISTLDE